MGGATDAVDELLELALSDPMRAQAEVAAVLETSRAPSDAARRATALQARGLIARQQGRLDEAGGHFREAIDVAVAAGLRHVEGQVRVSMAPNLALAGDPDGALKECDRAAALVEGRWRARLEAQRAAMLRYVGRTDEALALMRRTLAALRRQDDPRWEARLLHNRAACHMERNELTDARSDLVESERLAAAHHMDRLLAQARHHLGAVAAGLGDLPGAVRWFDAADDVLTRLGITDARSLFDRAEVFRNAGLELEALASAQAAVRLLEAEGDALYAAEAQLAVAEAALALRRPDQAIAFASQARDAFQRQRRPGYAEMARFALLRAKSETGADLRLLNEARRVAGRLHSARFVDQWLEASLLAGNLALRLDRVGEAMLELRPAAAHRRRGSPSQRVKAWQAEALVRMAASDLKGARRAVRAGLRVFDDHRASLGATELRAHAAAQAAALAGLGLRLAASQPSSRTLFEWMEMTRAGALRMPAVRPPDDVRLAEDLAALRRVESDLRRAELEGGDTRTQRREQARLQATIRRRTRQVPGAVGARLAPLRAAEVLERLDGRALVEMAEIDGMLHAVVLAGGRARRFEVGPVERVSAELGALRAALRRVTMPSSSEASHAAALAAVQRGREALDRAILGPLPLGDAAAVLVPPPILQAAPWGSLPSLLGRSTVVAPSARLWLDRRLTPDESGEVLLANGPRLPRSAAETRALQQVWPGAIRLVARSATTHAVLAAMEGSGLVHLVCHGAFRADNPLFSSLELADGGLYVYDLERLRRPPATMVLSSCDVGLPAVRPGDEVLGVVAALLGSGTRTVVASVGMVPDAAVSRRLMVAFHGSLAAGASPAAALAGALQQIDGSDPASASASSFVCFGAG